MGPPGTPLLLWIESHVVSVFMGVSPFPIIFFKAFLGILVLFSDSGSLLCGTTFE